MDTNVRYVVIFNRYFAGSCGFLLWPRRTDLHRSLFSTKAVFGGMALIAMFVTSMMSPILVRRLACWVYLAFIAVALLPVFGTDFSRGGALVCAGLCLASPQPEFLKPGFVVVSAWMLAAEINGPYGRIFVYLGDVHRCDAGPAARFWSGLFGVVPAYGVSCILWRVRRSFC